MAGFNYGFEDACGTRHTRWVAGHKTARFAFVTVIHRGTKAAPISPRPDDVSWFGTVEKANAAAETARVVWPDKRVSVFPLTAAPSVSLKSQQRNPGAFTGAPGHSIGAPR